MKKKIFLTFLVVMVFTCLFAISVSAEVTTYNDAPEKTNIETRLDDVVVFDDGFTCPSAYVFKDSKSTPDGSWSLAFANATDFSYVNEKTGKNYTFSNVVELDIPQGITYVGKYSAYKCTTLKKISFPNSVETLGICIFEGTTGLEQCVFEHNENSMLTTIPDYTFSGCTNLQAISLPDCITTITGTRAFAGCTGLTAVYLSKNLTSIVNCGDGSGRGDLATFDGNSNMYFVSEPFTYDSIPEKPSIYYFPKNLQSLANNGLFRNNSALNETVVFSDKLTSIVYTYMFEKSGNKTVVFLGDMENVTAQHWSTKTIYFANKADLSDDNVETISGSQSRIYCNAEGNTNHLYEKTEEKAATCTEAKGVYEYCFCGKIINSTTEGNPLGHEQGELVSRYFPAIVGGDGSLNYFVDMITEHDCTRCDDTIKGTEPNTALFAADGYSIPEKDDSTCISHTIKVNKTNVANYEALTGDKVDYGVVAGASTSLSAPVVINNGEIDADTYALVGDMTGTEYTKLVIKVTGLEAGDQISCNAYIVFNKDSEKIYYLCGDTVTKTALAKSL